MQAWRKFVAAAYRTITSTEIQNNFASWDKRRLALIKNKGAAIDW